MDKFYDRKYERRWAWFETIVETSCVSKLAANQLFDVRCGLFVETDNWELAKVVITLVIE